MCQSKSLQKKMVHLFEEKVSKIPTTFSPDTANERKKASYPIPSIEREKFRKIVQEEYPNLLYHGLDGLVTIDDFAVKIESELEHKQAFFNKAIGIIREITGHDEYDLDSELFSEIKPKSTDRAKRSSEECNYFIKCQKVYNVLSRKMYTTLVFHPSAPALARARTLGELIDLYYRKGKL